MGSDKIIPIVIILTAVAIIMGFVGEVTSTTKLKNAVGEQAHKICLEEYGSRTLDRMPAKCLKYFQDEEL